MPVTGVIKTADPNTMLVLWNKASPQDEDEKGARPESGTAIAIWWQDSLSSEPISPDSEVWSDTIIKVPITIDRFDMAATLSRPIQSKSHVLDADVGNDVHFEFDLPPCDHLEVYARRIINGVRDVNEPQPETWLGRILLGQHNHKPLPEIGRHLHMSNTMRNEWNSLVADVTANNNEAQTLAVNQAVSRPFTLIKCPQGIGKSTVMRQITKIPPQSGEPILAVAPSKSAIEHNADAMHELFTKKGYNHKEVHWVRKVIDEKMIPVHGDSLLQEPTRRHIHILGLQNAPPGILNFFEKELVQQLEGRPHPLSLKTRILKEMEVAKTRPAHWVSRNPNILYNPLASQLVGFL
ncbi:hypothetical protein D0Z07_6909 [Hyphodiscus hymeniophilus]|uniref:Uncharacterized protein n=1 Tax=Hyphodiscus hymeniophilus TaxID=353542 RepID=A0A9P6VGE1_9HELO|nr:hypothetical protein D0Z07_6909 [Hyphodiscus hymeniophilus]